MHILFNLILNFYYVSKITCTPDINLYAFVNQFCFLLDFVVDLPDLHITKFTEGAGCRGQGDTNQPQETARSMTSTPTGYGCPRHLAVRTEGKLAHTNGKLTQLHRNTTKSPNPKGKSIKSQTFKNECTVQCAPCDGHRGTTVPTQHKKSESSR